MEVRDESIKYVRGLPDYRGRKKIERDLDFEKEVESYLSQVYLDAKNVINRYDLPKQRSPEQMEKILSFFLKKQKKYPHEVLREELIIEMSSNRQISFEDLLSEICPDRYIYL